MNCWNGDDSPAWRVCLSPTTGRGLDWNPRLGRRVNIGEATLLIGVGAGPVDLREKAHDLGTVQALRWHLEHQTQLRVRCHGTMLGGLELAHAALVRAPIPLPAIMRHITVQASTTSL